MKTGPSASAPPTSSAIPAGWAAVDFLLDFPRRSERLGLFTETIAWVARGRILPPD